MPSQPNIPEINPWRFEYKYLMPVQKAYQLRNAITPFMELDPFSSRAVDHKYLVRSLYFDTRFLNFYQEKVDGESDRVKFRIRTYSQTLDPKTVLRAEIKIRKGTLMEKYSTFIPYAEYESYIKDHRWMELENPILVEFERYHWLKCLQPQVLIQYLREGYSSRDKKEIRITFDHRVSSTSSKSLFPRDVIFREHHKHAVIFEIKCKKGQPGWLMDLVKEHGLKIVTSSKFAKGIEVSKPGIVNPGWSC